MADPDIVIVGAGSAGCVLAARLAEDPARRVLLLEAGGDDGHLLVRVPLGAAKAWNSPRFNWSYASAPETATGERPIFIPRGKVLGGSSSINMMAWVRGHRADYDRWAASGLAGWSYDDVLPYFKRAEDFEDGASDYRGAGGPVAVRRGRANDPLYEAFFESAPSLGYGFNPDYNGAAQEGFARTQFNVRDGRRASAAAAYLRPALRKGNVQKGNVQVVTDAHATRVLFENQRAIGVEYLQGGQRRQVRAGEVIVASGAINSPQLLMLSGIGPADELRRHGIDVRIDLPGVGRNHQDHPAVRVSYLRATSSPITEELRLDRLAMSMARAWCTGTGFAAEPPAGVTAFIHSGERNTIPDLQLFCVNAALGSREWFPGWRAPLPDGFLFRACHLRTESRGTIRLASADPLAAPRMTMGFLGTDGERRALRESIRRVRDICQAPSMRAQVARELAPGPEVQSDEELDAYIRSTVDTIYHPLGACRMGMDADAVVGADFRVRGTEGLRVVDASVMPDLVGGNINAAVIMIAEKAADVIRGK